MTNSNSTPTFGINPFVLRQTPESEFTHFDGGWDRLLELVREHFHEAKPGYREGVCLVPVPAEGFFCGVVVLEEGDKLVGEYKARRPGEEPRKTTRVLRPRERHVGPAAIERGAHWTETYPIPGAGKSACAHVDVVLYSRETLEEGGEDCTGEDWDVISVNGRLTDEEMPIAPMTLIANHFELDGGTATGMSSEEFEAALRESVLFWKNKAMLAPKGA
jgi:hypothetical protein